MSADCLVSEEHQQGQAGEAKEDKNHGHERLETAIRYPCSGRHVGGEDVPPPPASQEAGDEEE